MIFTFCGYAPRWEEEERSNYDLETMRQEFKERLYAKLPSSAMNLGRLSESGGGVASKRYGDPEDPMQYQAVPVYCPNPLCGKEKVVTGGTKTWPRCEDCDEPMRREHELPENQKA